MGLNKTKKIKDWCPDTSRVDIKKRKIVRCPTCNKRLLPQVVFSTQEYEDVAAAMLSGSNDIFWKIPPHKAK